MRVYLQSAFFYPPFFSISAPAYPIFRAFVSVLFASLLLLSALSYSCLSLSFTSWSFAFSLFTSSALLFVCDSPLPLSPSFSAVEMDGTIHQLGLSSVVKGSLYFHRHHAWIRRTKSTLALDHHLHPRARSCSLSGSISSPAFFFSSKLSPIMTSIRSTSSSTSPLLSSPLTVAIPSARLAYTYTEPGYPPTEFLHRATLPLDPPKEDEM